MVVILQAFRISLSDIFLLLHFLLLLLVLRLLSWYSSSSFRCFYWKYASCCDAGDAVCAIGVVNAADVLPCFLGFPFYVDFAFFSVVVAHSIFKYN